MSRNRVIGRGGRLPWHLPADLQRFKRRTMGSAVIMGRKTWATMNKPLPGRTNVVITRDASFQAQGATVVCSLNDALAAARAAHPNAAEIFVVGGAEIYRLALAQADRIDLTLIEAVITDGDAFFPEFESDSTWRLVSSEQHAADDRHEFAYAFLSYERQR